MKLAITLTVISLSIIAGLSLINVNMVQHQKQEQNQIVKQYNTQLTIVDTTRRITNIVWEVEKINSLGTSPDQDVKIFINTLTLFQQMQMKMVKGERFVIYVFYPTLNTQITIKTNSQEQSQTSINDIKFNLFEKFKKTR